MVERMTVESKLHIQNPHWVLPETSSSTALNAQPSSDDLPRDWEYALVVRDAHLCRDLANEAATKRDVSAVGDLCRLVSTQADLWQCLSGERSAWRWARISAINALVRIGDPVAIPHLMQILSEKDSQIRETVAFALPTFGKAVLPHLRARLRDSLDCDDFAANMAMEYRIGSRVILRPDFAEGVRAVIIDKDHAPQWQPPTPEAVTDDLIDAIFAPLPADEEWKPL